ncbi:FAD-dependent monooxygenase [Sphaerisporangium sp. NPDC005288]|uniref:FAD-dependent monooxygenase n=1 Tax=Sphaerisporangium sp. NPDC005288 TaxID=3155114 RepID=UPI0033A73AB6
MGGMTAQVVIAGAGPTGLMLACELRLAGVDVLVLERDAERADAESRAGGMHARTLEVLDQRGMVEPFLRAGRPLPGGHFSALPLDFRNLPTRHPHLLVLLQRHIERLLEEHATRLGVRLWRGAEVTGLRQSGSGVEVEVLGGGPQGNGRHGEAGQRWMSAEYLVGCDGGRSAVRRLAGIGFAGTSATLTAMLGDVELDAPPEHPLFQERREHGTISVLSFEPGWHRVMTTEFDQVAGRDEPVTLEGLRRACLKIAGTDYGMRSPRWLSRFGDAARQAVEYRSGRVLLAGDAAHVHFPAGGQGLNLGVQDAVNLGWKLALVVHGHAPDSLLDSYHAERHPVGARVLENTRAQTALSRVDGHTTALRATLADLLSLDDVNARLSSMITALDVHYPMDGAHLDDRAHPSDGAHPGNGARARGGTLLGQRRHLMDGGHPVESAHLVESALPDADTLSEVGTLSGQEADSEDGGRSADGGHPLVGYRVPDVELEIDTGEVRVFELLHQARGVLLCLDGGAQEGPAAHLAGIASEWADRVDLVRARPSADVWQGPVVGAVRPPVALLVRPDGHIAWATGARPDLDGARAALTTWFGPARR